MSLDPAGLLADLAGSPLLVALIVGIALSLLLRRRAPRPVDDGPEDDLYRVYTRDFDLELTAADLRTALPDASPDAQKGWHKRDHALWHDCLSRLEAILAEQEDQAWSAARHKIERAAKGMSDAGIVVSLLIDHSGSMKGERIAWAATLATKIVPLLEELGIRSEILGFTTAGWHGGHARLHWVDAGKPQRPGRLCALLHIVYKFADADVLSEEGRATMLDPAILRENVDGEAILWAHSRLLMRPEQRKLLVVVSDGAPVDDSTLLHNGPSYLFRHLHSVVQQIADEKAVTLGGLGLGHSVESVYPYAQRVDAPGDMPGAAGALLESMLRGANEEKAGPPLSPG